ncbi:MAG TPA: YciI family protein [Stellaceae bacterium]|nr:YciI family protein [Stellaceae bacterium]
MSDTASRAQQMAAKMLGTQLYVVHTTPVAPREKIAELLPQHLEHQVRLEKSGVMFAAGPLMNEDGSPGGGLIVIRAESFADARAIADTDPLHAAELRTYTIRRWTVNEGSYSLTINYSDQSVSIG